MVRLGEWTVDGLERAQVHWSGKGGKSKGKIWNCVVLTPEPGSGCGGGRDRGNGHSRQQHQRHYIHKTETCIPRKMEARAGAR